MLSDYRHRPRPEPRPESALKSNMYSNKPHGGYVKGRLTKLNFTRRITTRDRSVKVSTDLRSEDIRMNRALEIAISPTQHSPTVKTDQKEEWWTGISECSLPDPMAIPTSDVAKAGASLMPSPTIPTIQRSDVASARRRVPHQFLLSLFIPDFWSQVTFSAYEH
jgi:hypothetical protein